MLATAVVAAAAPIADLGARASLGHHASLTLATALAALLVPVAAALGDRPPARWYISSAFAVSLGANLAATRWLATPLAVLGLVGVLALEIQRRFDGLTIGADAVTLHNPLKDPFTLSYAEIEAVHTTSAGSAGTLILETDHGTVTARDLPAVHDLQARVEARMGTFDVDDPEQAARRARKTIQELVRGPKPS